MLGEWVAVVALVLLVVAVATVVWVTLAVTGVVIVVVAVALVVREWSVALLTLCKVVDGWALVVEAEVVVDGVVEGGVVEDRVVEDGVVVDEGVVLVTVVLVLAVVVVVVTGAEVVEVVAMVVDDETGVFVPTAGIELASNVAKAASVETEGLVNRVERVAGEDESNWAKVVVADVVTGTAEVVVVGVEVMIVVVVREGSFKAFGCSDEDECVACGGVDVSSVEGEEEPMSLPLKPTVELMDGKSASDGEAVQHEPK